jgi:hypothetical protein
MTAPTTTRTTSPNGSGPVRLAPPRRRVRVPELALGVLVTVGFALGAVLWHLNSVDRVPVLATATAIGRGEVIEAADVRVVYLAADDPVTVLGSSESAAVVGQVASVDLAEGSLLTRDVVEPALTVDPGAGVVGLALDPGQFPTRGLAPGDRVDVVAPTDSSVEGAQVVLAAGATVYAVEELASDRLLVSILAGEQDARTVAAAAGSPLRLVLVNR